MCKRNPSVTCCTSEPAFMSYPLFPKRGAWTCFIENYFSQQQFQQLLHLSVYRDRPLRSENVHEITRNSQLVSFGSWFNSVCTFFNVQFPHTWGCAAVLVFSCCPPVFCWKAVLWYSPSPHSWHLAAAILGSSEVTGSGSAVQLSSELVVHAVD